MTGTPDWLDSVLVPHPEDSTDVRWAIETAVAMWSRGDRAQAVRWTHHAVQAATADGRHERAEALDRAASELEQRPLPKPPSQSPPPAASTTQPQGGDTAPIPPTPQAAGRSRANLPVTAPYRIAPDEITQLGSPDAKLIEACEPSGPAAPIQPPASVTDFDIPAVLNAKPERPRPPTIMTDSLDATITNVRPRAPATRDGAESTVVMDDDEMAQERPKSTSSPATLGSRHTALEPMRAVRVAIRSGVGKELLVSLLDEDQAAPDGTQEALLIPTGRATGRGG